MSPETRADMSIVNDRAPLGEPAGTSPESDVSVWCSPHPAARKHSGVPVPSTSAEFTTRLAGGSVGGSVGSSPPMSE